MVPFPTNSPRVALAFFAVLLCGVVVSETTHAADPPKAPTVRKKSYRAIYRDFYDLGTPHNRHSYYSFGFNLKFTSLVPIGGFGETLVPPPSEEAELNALDPTTVERRVQASYETFFNFQFKPYFRFAYNFETFLLFGANTFATEIAIKKESYQHVSLIAAPVLLGFKFRFTEGDLVPFISVAAGGYYNMFKATEEQKPEVEAIMKFWSFGYQTTLGAEFYIQPTYGLSVELGLEQILHGVVKLRNKFEDGPFHSTDKTTGVLLASSFFYEF